MAEGPVVHHYVRQLKKALEGKTVDVEFGVKKLKEYEASMKNIRAAKVEAHGKQFRIHFSDHRVLLVHLMMWGSWRIYPKGKPWDKDRIRARVIVHTQSHDAVAFSAPVVKLLTPAELQENPSWGNLGPDPLRADFSSREFFRRLDQQTFREIGEALLDQQTIAGIGNILRIEILFGARIHPHRPVASLSPKERAEMLHWILKLFAHWIKEVGRQKTWIRIYRRSGKPCPVCGTPIRFFRQAGRITYACPSCQR
jgi:endonuclease-8